MLFTNKFIYPKFYSSNDVFYQCKMFTNFIKLIYSLLYGFNHRGSLYLNERIARNRISIFKTQILLIFHNQYFFYSHSFFLTNYDVKIFNP